MNRILLFLLLFCVNTNVNTQNYTIDTHSGATLCENCDEVD